MLIPSDAWAALVAAGVEVTATDARHVELRHGAERVRLVVHAASQPLSPSDIASLVARRDGAGLLVVPAATAAAREAAARGGWSWLVASDSGVHGLLFIGTQQVRVGRDAAAASLARARKPGRPPWGTLTVVRCLLQRPAAHQHELATWAGVSQPRVSQALAALAGQELVERGPSGWRASDFDRVLDWWLDNYPGPGGISTYWYGLDSPRNQALAVIRSSLGDNRRDADPPIVVSGDVAADVLAPWRAPARAVLYAHSGMDPDLVAAGLIAAGAQEATLELTVPQDPGLWPRSAATRPEPELPLADPLQVLWDVLRSPGPDNREAAAILRDVLRSRLRDSDTEPT